MAAFERRTVTPATVADQLSGARRLAPGIWVDREGALHVSVPELLQHFGWPDTPEGREECATLVRAVFKVQAPGTTIIQQDPES